MLLSEATKLGDRLRELGGDPTTLEKEVKTDYGILIIPNDSEWKPSSLEDTPPLRAHHVKHPEAIALALRINQHSLFCDFFLSPTPQPKIKYPLVAVLLGV